MLCGQGGSGTNGSRQADATGADAQSPGHSAGEVGTSDSGQTLWELCFRKVTPPSPE